MYLYLFKRISLSLFLKDLILLSFRRELSREFHSFGPVYLVVLWASDERVKGMWKREAWCVEYECGGGGGGGARAPVPLIHVVTPLVLI